MEKWKNDLSWSKNSRKMFTTDIFIYESLEVSRGSKNVGWIYLLNKGPAKHHNKHQAKTLKIQDISVRRDVKMFSEENCPCGRQMPKQLWQRKKGGKYEWTEGTTIIYVNNVPLLLIISGKIKQKRKGGEKNITHVTQLIFLMQINNRNYKWKWCCCDRERKRESNERCPAFFSLFLFFTLFGIHYLVKQAEADVVWHKGWSR